MERDSRKGDDSIYNQSAAANADNVHWCWNIYHHIEAHQPRNNSIRKRLFLLSVSIGDP